MLNLFIYVSIYQHNCLNTYFRHGSHAVLMTLMIDTYICREMNICIFYQNKNVYLFSPGMVFILLMIWYIWYSYVHMYAYVWFDIHHMPRDVSIYIHICMHIYLSYFYRHMNWIIHLFNLYMIELLMTRLLNDWYLQMPRGGEVSSSSYPERPHLLH